MSPAFPPGGWPWFLRWIMLDLTLFEESTTNLRIDDEDFEPPIFQLDHYAWAIGSTELELPNTVVEAEAADLTHGLGRASGDGWEVTPDDGPGIMLNTEGDLFGSPSAGERYVFQMEAMVDTLPEGSGSLPVASYALWDGNSETVITGDIIYLSDFTSADRYQPFRIEFTAEGAEILQPFIIYWGNASLNVDRFSIALE